MSQNANDSPEYRAMNDARRAFYERWSSWLKTNPDSDIVAIETFATLNAVTQIRDVLSGAAS